MQTEALVASTPLIHYVNTEKYDLKALYPFYQARSVAEIREAMESCITNEGLAKARAEEAFLWFEKYVNEAICFIVEKLGD